MGADPFSYRLPKESHAAVLDVEMMEEVVVVVLEGASDPGLLRHFHHWT